MIPFWENRSHLTIVDDLLLYDDRILIPRSKRLQILDCIHTGHLRVDPGHALPYGGRDSTYKSVS